MARTVLVADDSPSIQNKAKGILTGEGLEVVTVSNGVAAIKKLPDIKPLLILADVSMPGKDGYEVCEYVKNSPELSHLPVILVFSDMEPYDEGRGRRARADAKIMKKSGVRDPFDYDELVSTVTRLLAQAEGAAPSAEAPAPEAAPPPTPEPSEVSEAPEMAPEAPAKEPELAGLEEGVAFTMPGLAETAPPPAPESLAPELRPAEEAAPVYSEPVLIEETPPHTPEPPAPTAERTMIFRPVEIAEPILSDELAATAPLVEAAAEVGPEIGEQPSTAYEGEAPAMPATSLESFSLTEAAAGQVQFGQEEVAEAATEAAAETAAARPEAAAPEFPTEERLVPEEASFAEAPAPEAGAGEMAPEEAAPPELGAPEAPSPEAAPPEGAAPEYAPPPTVGKLDSSLIYSVVHKVVVRMAPAVLPAGTIEEIARRLTDEIAADLEAESAETQ